MREVDFDGLKAGTRAVQNVLNGVGQAGPLAATEAQVLLQMLIEHIPVGILVAYGAPDFPVVLVNRAAEVLLGCSRDALLGRPAGAHATVFSLVPLGDSAREACQGLPLYRTAYLGYVVQDEEWSLLRADGTRSVVLMNTNPLRDAFGIAVGGILCLRDISRLKRMEDALRESEQRLREADQRKDRFLAVLAHELRGPLAPVQCIAEVLKAKAKVDQELANVSKILQRQVADMARLLDDLLDLSRVTVGKLRLERQRVDLAAVIAHAVEWADPAIRAKQHRLGVSLRARTVIVDADAGRLAQVFSNLLTNAAKYTDPGGEIGIDLTVADGTALVSIRDSGRGLDQVDMKHLFDLFFQPERTLDRAEGGLGIGLSLVQDLVHMHGGSVHAHSAGRGKGSEFVVMLPLAAE